MCTLVSELWGKLKTEALINPEDRVMVKTKMKYFFILANYQLTLCLFILLLLFFKRGHLRDAVAFCSGFALASESHLS